MLTEQQIQKMYRDHHPEKCLLWRLSAAVNLLRRYGLLDRSVSKDDLLKVVMTYDD